MQPLIVALYLDHKENLRSEVIDLHQNQEFAEIPKTNSSRGNALINLKFSQEYRSLKRFICLKGILNISISVQTTIHPIYCRSLPLSSTANQLEQAVQYRVYQAKRDGTPNEPAPSREIHVLTVLQNLCTSKKCLTPFVYVSP